MDTNIDFLTNDWEINQIYNVFTVLSVWICYWKMLRHAGDKILKVRWVIVVRCVHNNESQCGHWGTMHKRCSRSCFSSPTLQSKPRFRVIQNGAGNLWAGRICFVFKVRALADAPVSAPLICWELWGCALGTSAKRWRIMEDLGNFCPLFAAYTQTATSRWKCLTERNWTRGCSEQMWVISLADEVIWRSFWKARNFHVWALRALYLSITLVSSVGKATLGAYVIISQSLF